VLVGNQDGAKNGTRWLVRGLAHMPIEFLHGQPLGPQELEIIRRQIEEGAEVIAAVDDEIRGIVVRNWPHLLSKLPPPEDE